jgi:SAM-dependent methyltransferase
MDRANESGCRSCGAALTHTFIDLGTSPLANSYIRADQLNRTESFYPLHVRVCDRCFLVQLEPVEDPAAIFSDYAYFSSYSESWLTHASDYVEGVTARFSLNRKSRIVEIASNDGYLLQYFVAKGIPVLGIEPARNVAEEAIRRGIPTEVRFFDDAAAVDLVSRGGQADLIVGNNVLAHVPKLNDFVAGLKILLRPCGSITLEFPHLLRLIDESQFDTIYHEHVSYFSLLALEPLFERHGLKIFDVDELPTHGGSLRIYVAHDNDSRHAIADSVANLLERERRAGLASLDSYSAFEDRVKGIKRQLLRFLIDAKEAGKSVVGYGAPAKGNTLLNYCGIRSDMIDYTVDRSPHKQQHFLPGTHIPIYAPEKIAETRPDFVLILPWNLKAEVTQQMHHIREWGGRFVVPIPSVGICS